MLPSPRRLADAHRLHRGITAGEPAVAVYCRGFLTPDNQIVAEVDESGNLVDPLTGYSFISSGNAIIRLEVDDATERKALTAGTDPGEVQTGDNVRQLDTGAIWQLLDDGAINLDASWAILSAVSWTDVTGKPTTFAPSAHSHVLDAWFTTALATKSDTSHTHAGMESDIEDAALAILEIQGELAGLGGAAQLDVGTTAGTVAAGDDARFGAGAQELTLSGSESIEAAITNPIVFLRIFSTGDLGVVLAPSIDGDILVIATIEGDSPVSLNDAGGLIGTYDPALGLTEVVLYGSKLLNGAPVAEHQWRILTVSRDGVVINGGMGEEAADERYLKRTASESSMPYVSWTQTGTSGVPLVRWKNDNSDYIGNIWEVKDFTDVVVAGLTQEGKWRGNGDLLTWTDPTNLLPALQSYRAEVRSALRLNVTDVPLTGDITNSNPTGAVDGDRFEWRFRAVGGDWEVTLDTKFVIGGVVVMTNPFTMLSGEVSHLSAIYDATADVFRVVSFIEFA